MNPGVYGKSKGQAGDLYYPEQLSSNTTQRFIYSYSEKANDIQILPESHINRRHRDSTRSIPCAASQAQNIPSGKYAGIG